MEETKRDRTILHCDCNAFFASVETALRPELASGPMAVCGDPDSRHGIILAKNEKAKAFGIQTAETIWQAKHKCPALTLVSPHRDAYVEYSHRCNALYLQYTDLVDPFGIDESFLDVTGSMHLFGSGVEIADTLRRRMREEVGLTISVGVSFNRAFAKLGSDYRKPDATTVFSRQNYKEKVWPQPVSTLLYVGRRATERFASLGVHTIGDLAACDEAFVRSVCGKTGETLLRYARGEDEERVRPFDETREVKSVGKGMTFAHNLIGEDALGIGIAALCDDVGRRLRRRQMQCQTVQLLIRDPDFKNRSRQMALERPTDSTRELQNICMQLLREHWRPEKPVRMLTVTASQLVPRGSGGEQMSLFDENAAHDPEKQRKIDSAMDALRRKYGSDAVRYGTTLRRGELATKKETDDP